MCFVHRRLPIKSCFFRLWGGNADERETHYVWLLCIGALFVSYLMIGALFVGYPLIGTSFGFGEGTRMSGRRMMSGSYLGAWGRWLLFLLVGVLVTPLLLMRFGGDSYWSVLCSALRRER